MRKHSHQDGYVFLLKVAGKTNVVHILNEICYDMIRNKEIARSEQVMTVSISLMEFYQLEAIRRAGYTDETILETLADGNINKWKEDVGTFDFAELQTLYEKDKQAFETALTEGYKIKFLTFPGLQRLLEMKFDRIADMDFEVKENYITNLQLSLPEVEQLEQILSANWKIEQVDKGKVRIALAQ